MPTIYSYEEFTGDGANTDFAVNNPYIHKDHVSLKVNSVEVTFSWVNDSLVRADAAPGNGTTVRVERNTPVAAALVDYTDGSTLAENDLDLQALQLLYVAQESYDNAANLTVEAAQTAAAQAATSATAAATSATDAEADRTYAAEWANNAEDALVSAAAGGDQVDDYSAMHHAIKAAASAASTNLPVSMVGNALDYLRVNAGETAYEHRTVEQAKGDWSLALAAHGKCRLVLNGANLELQKHGGNTFVIDGVLETIPGTNPTLAPTGAAANTLYFIYAYMNAGVMTLERSTTGHSTHTNGVEIKTGDATRTLVGMARTNASTQWVDSLTQRFVLSWFNRRIRLAVISDYVGAASNSTYLAPNSTHPPANRVVYSAGVNTTLLIEWLDWGDGQTVVTYCGGVVNNTAGFWTSARIGIDDVGKGTCPLHSSSSPFHEGELYLHYRAHDISEGYHFSFPLGSSVGGVGSFYRNRNTAEIWG